MPLRKTLREWLFADAPAAPSTEDRAAASAATAQFGDTQARIEKYNSEKISEGTFDKMMRHHQVRFGMSVRELLLTAPDWSVTGSDPRIAAYVDAVLERIRVRLVRSCVRKGAMRGMAPFETVWERAATEISYPDENGESVTETVEGYRFRKLKSIARANVRAILTDGLEELLGFEVINPSGVRLMLDAGECFVFTHNMEDGNHWGEADLVGAYEPWYRGQVTWDQWVRYTERFATPPTVVFFPTGKDTDGNDNADSATALADGFMGSNASARLPLSETDGKWEKSWDIEFKTAERDSGQSFKESIEYHDRAMLRGLLMPDTAATQQQDTGSLALSQTHMSVLELIEDGLLDEIIDAVNTQLVPAIVRYTFGADAAVPVVSSVGLSDDKVSKLQAMLDKAVEKGYWTSADWDAMADTLGIPVAEVEEEPDEETVEETPTDEDEAREAVVAMREAAQAVRLKLAVQQPPRHEGCNS